MGRRRAPCVVRAVVAQQVRARFRVVHCRPPARCASGRSELLPVAARSLELDEDEVTSALFSRATTVCTPRPATARTPRARRCASRGRRDECAPFCDGTMVPIGFSMSRARQLPWPLAVSNGDQAWRDDDGVRLRGDRVVRLVDARLRRLPLAPADAGEERLHDQVLGLRRDGGQRLLDVVAVIAVAARLADARDVRRDDAHRVASARARLLAARCDRMEHSAAACVRCESLAAVRTMNGVGLSITNFCSPRAMRRIVFSASGRLIRAASPRRS
jgi:hypothetical protein